MKVKFLVPIVLSIVVGFLIGKVFFNDYNENSLSVFEEGEKVYFVQMGVYSSLEALKSNVKNYKDHLYLEEEDGYHLYVGITKNKKTAENIKVYYESLANNIYIKEKYVSNYSFLNILTEYDKITSIASNGEDLIGIEKIVISNYKEMVVENGVVN